jgi:hypothetical protein
VTVIVDYFFNIPTVSVFSKEFVQWRNIVAAFALALGVGNLTRIHSRALNQKKEYWFFSLVLLVTMYGYIALGVLTTTRSVPYTFFWHNLFQPLSGTWYSMTVFYMTSACWRAFRIKTPQAAVMLGAAVLAMLGQVGIGQVIWSELPVIKTWLQGPFTTAGMRGITIGAALGMISLSFRVILGLERSHLGGMGE